MYLSGIICFLLPWLFVDDPRRRDEDTRAVPDLGVRVSCLFQPVASRRTGGSAWAAPLRLQPGGRLPARALPDAVTHTFQIPGSLVLGHLATLFTFNFQQPTRRHQGCRYTTHHRDDAPLHPRLRLARQEEKISGC